MERPTLRQLEILAEVARAGTFRGAARNLGLSQVAVSDHIKQLESRLGVALFVRNAGGKPSLSPSGKIVLDHGRNVLFACDALIAAARGEAEPEEMGGEDAVAILADLPDMDGETEEPEPEADLSGLSPKPGFLPILPPLSVMSSSMPLPQSSTSLPLEEPADAAQGEVLEEPQVQSLVDLATRSVAPEPIIQEAIVEAVVPQLELPAETAPVSEKPITVASHPAILSRFQDRLAAAQEAFPDRPIAVDFARFTPDAVTHALRSGRADIALFYALGEVPGIMSDYLWSERWSLFARADHPLAQKEAVHLRDCEDMLVILFDEANPIRPLAETCLAQAGLWPTPTVLETDDFAAIAAELDYGEAIFPAFGVTAQQFAARPGIRRLALVEPLPGIEIRRAVAPAMDEDPVIAALAGLLG
ncbi:MAG TPA: LysR family transcriptional regulator [Sphingobium sp.]|uniref:LysR family transcriptional regulator n=1 Tax=Sphingobium sp. TaxID=1912891 RepID=UPI002ED5CEB0